jgi:hypothetical protein
MADVAGAERARELRLDLRPEHPAQLACDLEDRGTSPASDVDRATVGSLTLEREPTGAGDADDVDEVAPMPAVLADDRRAVVQQAGAKRRSRARRCTAASSSSARCEPMNPAPPVMSTLSATAGNLRV